MEETKQGRTVTKTLEELRAMEHMSKEEAMELFEKFKGSFHVPASFDVKKEFLEVWSMKNLFFDINILLDYLIPSNPFHEKASLLVKEKQLSIFSDTLN